MFDKSFNTETPTYFTNANENKLPESDIMLTVTSSGDDK